MRRESTSTRLARDVHAHIPPADEVRSIISLPPEHRAIWELAAPHLAVRNNDSHTLYAYGIARALVARIALRDAGLDAEVALCAILLHDTGWSTVRSDEILEAIAPGGGRPDLVRRHEIEGARIAREILTSLDHPPERVARVAEIIDGHDSRPYALTLEDAIVKDADKIWRVTPHGRGIVCGWFSLTPEESLRITAARVEDALFTDEGRAMAAAFIAAASIDLAPERAGLV
ncbi:MAG: HD domain-containing protein [Microbacterium sp.]|uniref:HD domain-containing protein n=1 Tax=Microbacterium sp. TaxID=51671 RepID=UPI001AC74582|nr:HD domain-containing protein [Microbacterium sp.]MBN9177576.1 HD domain-containing protein [Microbacterium sp.]